MKAHSLLIAILLLTSTAASAAGGAPKAISDIVYARVGDRALHMNLLLPSDAPGKPRPAVMWIHGGGWSGGDWHIDPSGDYGLTDRGFVTGTIEYRLSGEAKYPAQIQDCKAAIRFLRANAAKYGIDPNRIGVWGGSAGGHLVALLGTTAGIKQLEGDEGNAGFSSRVQAVCDLFGPTDLTSKRVGEYTPLVIELVEDLLGGPVRDNMGLARLASPVEFASKDDAPFLILHGDKDPLVPMSQSEELYNALKRTGADVTLVKVKNAGHGFAPHGTDPNLDQIKQMILTFFSTHL